MKLHLWKDLLWYIKGQSTIAYCPEHRIELDVNTVWGIRNQAIARVQDSKHLGTLICPTDDKLFTVQNNDLSLAIRRFHSTIESLNLRDAEIVSIDGYQIPIAKAKTPNKDDAYWVEARINDTKQGKQVVVYAGKRGESDKSQIFVDIENDKISFDQNNIHPNDIFFRLEGQFKSGKKVKLEADAEDE